MAVIQVILSIIYVLLGIAISIVILMQEGKSNGLGALSAAWLRAIGAKIKGRSMEGALEHFTRYGAIVFMIITLILNINFKGSGIIIRTQKHPFMYRIEGCFLNE